MADGTPDDGFEDILTGRRGAGRGGKRGGRPASSAGDDPQPAARGRRRFSVDALFSDTRAQAVGVEDLPDAKEIRLDRIVADPDQPRRSFDAVRLEELAASIRSEGVLQPIVVRYDPDGDRYVIVHGERRFRASQRAGRESIPALVRDVPEERRLIQQLMENIVRDDLNAVDRAHALRLLKARMDDAPWPVVAEAVGIRRSRLFQLLDTVKLPEDTRNRIRGGDLSEKQSRALQGLEPVYQAALGAAIVERDVPGDVATRVGRALRASTRQASSPDAAVSLVEELLDLAMDRSDDRTDRLLAHLAATTRGDTSRERLAEVATALGAPSWSASRATRSIADLAQVLARADAVRDDPDLARRLAALRDVIDALLRDDQGVENA